MSAVIPIVAVAARAYRVGDAHPSAERAPDLCFVCRQPRPCLAERQQYGGHAEEPRGIYRGEPSREIEP